jgi:ornithine cyclodeaminase/alanine dehydrogenase-like protein (mu-crystallin family)
MTPLLALSDADVRALLPMHEAIPLARRAFEQLAAGRADVPVRTRVQAGPDGAVGLVMPGALPDDGVLGVKAVTVQPTNRTLPSIHGLLILADAETGRPLALLNAEALTALRTGAVSGLATDLLARPDASVLAVFGAGAQAETQIDAVHAVRPLTRVLVFGLDPDQTERFAARATDRLGIEVRVARRPDELAEADVVCTATSSAVPVFDPAHLAPGAHVNAIGAYRPDMAEIPPETVRASAVVVDHAPACLAEAGDLLQAFDTPDAAAAHVAAEIGDLCLGRVAVPSGPTLFKSVGVAVQDLAAAAHVVRRAQESGLGTSVLL